MDVWTIQASGCVEGGVSAPPLTGGGDWGEVALACTVADTVAGEDALDEEELRPDSEDLSMGVGGAKCDLRWAGSWTS